MPPNLRQKTESRARILRAAAGLFRRHGYRGVGIDRIMAAAGLTRGAFYAHFHGKRALFVEVIQGQHGLTRLLAARAAVDPSGLHQHARAILADYLDPRHLAEVGRGCSFAALAGDVARAGRPAKRAYASALRELIGELDRGRHAGKSDTLALLALSIGAVSMARALEDADLAAALLNAAHAKVAEMLRG